MMEPGAETFARKHPEMAAAIAKVRAEALEAIASTGVADSDTREALYFKIRGLDEARKSIIDALDDKAMRDHAVTLDQ